MKRSKKFALLEVFSVIFAVLFALGVDAVYEDYQRKQLAEQALENIVLEIEKNNKELELQVLEIDTLIPNLDRYVQLLSGNKVEGSVSLDFEYPTFQTTAWETAKLTNVIPDIAYDDVVKITDVYEQLDFYRGLVDQLVNQILSPNMQLEEHRLAIVRTMRIIAHNLNNVSKGTIETHQEFLKNKEQH